MELMMIFVLQTQWMTLITKKSQSRYAWEMSNMSSSQTFLFCVIQIQG